MRVPVKALIMDPESDDDRLVKRTSSSASKLSRTKILQKQLPITGFSSQLPEALARQFLHFESPSRLSETCLEHLGVSSLVICAWLVLVCVLCPLTFPGYCGRFDKE